MTKAESLTAAIVTARLQTLAELSRTAPDAPPPIDMSSAAVTTRLLECAEITALTWELAGAPRGSL